MQMKSRSNTRTQAILLLGSFLAYLIQALRSLQLSGISFDEHIEAWGLIDTLRHGSKVLTGYESNFHDIVENLEFYGIINKLPGLLIWTQMAPERIQKIFSAEDPFKLLGVMGKTGYYNYSHATSIGFYLATLALVVLIARKCGVHNYLAPALLCFWWPSLVGHSFMNVKDTPFCFFYTLYSFSLILRTKDRDPLPKIAFSAACAACLISMKFPSFVPIGISEIFLILLTQPRPTQVTKTPPNPKTLSKKQLSVLTKRAALFILSTSFLTYIITPASWKSPISYMKDSFDLHTNHYWGGCTWLDGACVGKAADPKGWNSLSYITSWFGVQTPALNLLLLSLCIVALFTYLWKTKPRPADLARVIHKNPSTSIVFLQAFLLPLLAAANNSTLYGALRHFTFSIPALSILGIFGCEKFLLLYPSLRIPTTVVVAALSTLVVTDSILITPYQYTYLNEFSRSRIDLARTELDYWGFSSGELMRKVASSEPDKYGLIIGYRPMISTYLDILGRTDVPGGPRFNAHFTVDNLLKDSSRCRDLASVKRSLIGSDELIMSKAYICDE